MSSRGAALGLVVVLAACATADPVPFERPDVARAIRADLHRTLAPRFGEDLISLRVTCFSRVATSVFCVSTQVDRFHSWEWRLRAQRHAGEWLWYFDEFDAEA